MAENTVESSTEEEIKKLRNAVLHITQSNNRVIDYLLIENQELRKESSSLVERVSLLEKVSKKLFDALTSLEKEYSRTIRRSSDVMVLQRVCLGIKDGGGGGGGGEVKLINTERNNIEGTDSGSEEEEPETAVKKAEQPAPKRRGLRALHCERPVRVKFVNNTGNDVNLYCINFIGECERVFKLVDGDSEMKDTYETHPWIAANTFNEKVRHAYTINSNLVYQPLQTPTTEQYTVAEIKKAPENLADLESKPTAIEVAVKFKNRTTKTAYLEMITSQGQREFKYTVDPGKSCTVLTHEGTCWVTTIDRNTNEGLLLNYGWYYSPTKTRLRKEKCYITDYI